MFCYFVINNDKLYGPVSYPRHRGSICEGIQTVILYIMNENLGRIFRIANIVFLFCLSFPLHNFQNSCIYTHTHSYRFQSILDLTGNDSATASYDFENPIKLAEDEGEDDCEVPGELARLYSRKRGSFSHTKSQWKR